MFIISLVLAGLVYDGVTSGEIGGRGTTLKRRDHPIVFKVGIVVESGVSLWLIYIGIRLLLPR